MMRGKIRATVTLDEDLATRARQLGVNLSAAARQGISDAVRVALAQADRDAYRRHPEPPERTWSDAEAWGEP